MRNTSLSDSPYHELLKLPRKNPETISRFFKTQPGAYGEQDQFLGVSMPTLRTLAKQYPHALQEAIEELLYSPFNEARMLGLLLLTANYHASVQEEKTLWFNRYLQYKAHINNWNLVDASAPEVVGHYLYNHPRDILCDLAHSASLWDRRIAIVSTLFFIRKKDFGSTYKIADLLLSDKEDLIHKATGWMLREAGKREPSTLMIYLDGRAAQMPRTMLRYAIEKFSKSEQAYYRGLI